MPKRRAPDVELTCVVCEKKFIRPGHLRFRRFCSRVCFHKAGPHRPSRAREPETRECGYVKCANTFLVGGRGRRGLWSTYCSRRCTTSATHPFTGGAINLGRKFPDRAKPSYSWGFQRPGRERTERPTMLDIAWAAGVYEGEGTCSDNGALSVVQKDQWLCERLRALFGGSVRAYTSKLDMAGHRKVGTYHRWMSCGPRGRGFLMTIYSFLSPRRKEQIRVALGRAEDSSA